MSLSWAKRAPGCPDLPRRTAVALGQLGWCKPVTAVFIEHTR